MDTFKFNTDFSTLITQHIHNFDRNILFENLNTIWRMGAQCKSTLDIPRVAVVNINISEVISGFWGHMNTVRRVRKLKTTCDNVKNT